MYALIDTTAFHWKFKPKNPVPDSPACFPLQADGTQGASLPYSREEILTITAEHTLKKTYYETGINVCHAFFDVLDAHVVDAYKTAPTSAPSTIGWISMMMPNKIFEQLMLTYGKSTPNAMRQNNLTSISTYNPKDPPKLRFKRCANCQEVAIVLKVPYMSEQLLMNVIDLFMHLGIYAPYMDDWEYKAKANKTYVIHPSHVSALHCVWRHHCHAEWLRLP